MTPTIITVTVLWRTTESLCSLAARFCCLSYDLSSSGSLAALSFSLLSPTERPGRPDTEGLVCDGWAAYPWEEPACAWEEPACASACRGLEESGFWGGRAARRASLSEVDAAVPYWLSLAGADPGPSVPESGPLVFVCVSCTGPILIAWVLLLASSGYAAGTIFGEFPVRGETSAPLPESSNAPKRSSP